MSRYKASRETERKILETLALKGEFCQYDFPRIIKKSYRTVLRRIHRLEKIGAIELKREEPAAKGGKDKKIYGATLLGLMMALVGGPWNNIDLVANLHPDKLLIFKKWDYFKGEGLRENLVKGLQFAVGSWAEFLYIKDKIWRQEPSDADVPSSASIDGIALGLLFLGESDEEHSFFRDLWPACKADEELRSFVEAFTRDMRTLVLRNLKRVENAERCWDSL